MNKKTFYVTMVIGAITSALTINFTGPYLATLQNNPFKGSSLQGAFGYFNGFILEIMVAFVLIMLHHYEHDGGLGRVWMRTLAGLVLFVALWCAVMEDAKPMLVSIGQAASSSRAVELRLEEGKRLQNFIGKLSVNRNPANAVILNRQITKLKKEAIKALEKNNNALLAWIELFLNIFIKIAVIAANATVFYLAGSFRKELFVEALEDLEALTHSETQIQADNVIQIAKAKEDEKNLLHQQVEALNAEKANLEQASTALTTECKALKQAHSGLSDVIESASKAFSLPEGDNGNHAEIIRQFVDQHKKAKRLSIKNLSSALVELARKATGSNNYGDLSAHLQKEINTTITPSHISVVLTKAQPILKGLYLLTQNQKTA
jgi:hypothetical protein